MRRIAIFVEGQTELIFVREFLLKYFNYQNLSIECFTLFTDSCHLPTEYSFGNKEDIEYHFEILNVGNDKSVITRIKRRAQYMWDAGFERIIGLRDLYSKEYREAVQGQYIDPNENEKFVQGYRSQLNSDKICFSFAIMETEAWLLGLVDIFERMNSKLTIKYIEQQLGYNLESIDPETEFFHPAKEIDKIFKLAGFGSYDKSKGDVNSIVSYIHREDYITLLESNKCNSFKEFVSFLVIN